MRLKIIALILAIASFCIPCISETQEGLNRQNFVHKAQLPPIPNQSKDYINIANYNVRKSNLDKDTCNSWENRKEYYLKTIKMEDESHLLLEQMRTQLHESLSKHLLASCDDRAQFEKEIEKDCTTCFMSKKEAYPVFETKYFRIALKTSLDSKGILYGNFPYPYRLMIVLKRHAPVPSDKEWLELRLILETLETDVRKDIGAEYTSYGVFQDVYFKNKNAGKPISSTPHYFLHFIFRFPDGVSINGVQFKDPNPFDQFQFRHPNLIREEEIKSGSNFIYKRAPDIINIQELFLDQVEYLESKLPQHKLVGYTAYQGTPLESVKPDQWVYEILAIAYRADRFDCLDSGVRWISPTPNQPSIGYGASRERIIVWAKFKDIRSGQIFYMFNAHYDHLGGNTSYVDAEIATIREIAKDYLWFACGERFYKSLGGEKMYRHYLDSLECSDIRDISLLGHYGEAGSWGGFANDPFAVQKCDGVFDCDTLDVCFTNLKKNHVLFSYSANGAYDPSKKELYAFDGLVNDDFQLASDHFMTGFYMMLAD